MPLNLASPGIVVREVDLTVGRVNATSNKVGALVAPFAQGPVEVPTIIENEKDLLEIFGEPYGTDKHYENWLTASSYLAYGGSLRIVRSSGTELKNAFAGAGTSITIKSLEDYNNLNYDENTIPNFTVVAKDPGSWANGIKVALIDGKADQILGITTAGLSVGLGVTQSLNGRVLPGAGSTSVLTGYLKGIVSEIGTETISVKVLNYVNGNNVSVNVDYQPNGVYSFGISTDITLRNSSNTGISTTTPTTSKDWFDQQTIGITTVSSLSWNTLAERPTTTEYAASRSSRFDEVHVVIIDTYGDITGNAGTILEKHLGLSKAKDAQSSVGSPSYWREYLATNSKYIFGGSAPVGITTIAFSGNGSFNSNTLDSDYQWDMPAESMNYGATGATTLTLGGGKNYNGSTSITSAGALNGTLSNVSSGYDLFSNAEEYKVDFLLMGSAAYSKENAQALANKLISVAELRKDAIAFISPNRGSLLNDPSNGVVAVNSAETITENLISFYSPLTGSSYAVFDSGYKYMFDRFANTFRYVPLNGDIAGICARNDVNNFPWYSPAGTVRGTILNAVKLAYNPSKTQRDRLYSNRINPVIFSPGAGFVLFGDKTALGKASAFDRVNVRRLFIFLENAISAAAKDQLFEFNDEITRTNFVNIVEPFLRDVRSKRGIQDYVVICDETNNTAAVIDNNEFVADIYIKPARSINFIGLTFVATRTGVSFEEVIGNF